MRTSALEGDAPKVTSLYGFDIILRKPPNKKYDTEICSPLLCLTALTFFLYLDEEPAFSHPIEDEVSADELSLTTDAKPTGRFHIE